MIKRLFVITVTIDKNYCNPNVFMEYLLRLWIHFKKIKRISYKMNE